MGKADMTIGPLVMLSLGPSLSHLIKGLCLGRLCLPHRSLRSETEPALCPLYCQGRASLGAQVGLNKVFAE